MKRASRPSWSFAVLSHADGIYTDPRIAKASPDRIAFVRKADQQTGFGIIARRWIVERFFA